MDLTTILALSSFVIIIIYWITQKETRNLPPGPYGLPLLGYLPFLSSKPYLDLQKLAKRYGPIFRFRLGMQNVIVLSDYHTIKDAFAQDAFMGRPPVSIFELNKETLDTGAFNDLPWKKQRRFSLHFLRDIGFGRPQMEEMVKEEIFELLEHLEPFEGKPLVLKPILQPSLSNNITTLMYGKRLKYDDPVRKMLDYQLTEGAKANGQLEWPLYLPSLNNILRLFPFSAAAKGTQLLRETKKYAEVKIEEHEKDFNENNVEDYIDGYLLEAKKRNDEAFCKNVLVDNIINFFGAGSDNVRFSMEWLTLLMAYHPDVQEKVHAEIESVLGHDGVPCYNDQMKMPYTEATINEMLRWRTIIPLNVLRYTLCDTELNGYFIPRDHIVIANLWDLHHKPEYWGEDADSFRVDRFLTEDGKAKKPEYFIPFSIGRRICPGESFARIVIFLYFVSLLQKYKISFPPGTTPSFESQLGIALKPLPQELCLTKRV